MSLHDELFATAQHLAGRNKNKPSEADRRRSISTAYYALFHRLIDAVVTRVVTGVPQQAAVARMFEHGWMKSLCQSIRRLATRPKEPDTDDKLAPVVRLLGWPIPDEIKRVATAFTELQERRHAADYDRSFDPTLQITRSALKQAQEVFADLAAVEATPAGQAFLLLFLLGEPKAR